MGSQQTSLNHNHPLNVFEDPKSLADTEKEIKRKNEEIAILQKRVNDLEGRVTHYEGYERIFSDINAEFDSKKIKPCVSKDK